MKVCLDIQAAVHQQAGVGRYTQMLVEHLAASGVDDTLSAFYFDFRRAALPFPTGFAKLYPIRWCPGRLVNAAWNVLDFPPVNWLAGRADVYHFPNFLLPPLTHGRSVVTIHDVSFLRLPQFTEEKNLQHLTRRIRHTVERADAIITDSEFSAHEIQDLLPARRDQVHAIPLGISPAFQRQSVADTRDTLRRLGLGRPYILSVGTLEPRKNIPLLIEAFERLDDFPGLLVLAGRAGWKSDPILARIAASPRAHDIVRLPDVPETELCALYSGATVFAFPSWYEGFGFPPLEAMACETPVVSAPGGSLAEVLGSAALMVHAYEPEAWADALRHVLSDAALRVRLIGAGVQQAARYTWTETARRTWAVYQTVAS